MKVTIELLLLDSLREIRSQLEFHPVTTHKRTEFILGGLTLQHLNQHTCSKCILKCNSCELRQNDAFHHEVEICKNNMASTTN